MKLSFRGALAALLVLSVAILCVRLGFWQLDRLEQRRDRNAAVQRAMALPPLDLRDSAASVIRAPRAFLYRVVRVRGRYEPGGELVLRGRSHGGSPGVHLAEPLRIGADTAVMVNRGWAPAADAATLDPRRFHEPGPREVIGILVDAPATDDAARLDTRAGPIQLHTFARLPLDSLREAAPYALLPLYVQQLGGTPPPDSLPRRVPVAALSEGPHLGYAVQWFSFAAIAIIGFAFVLVRTRGRPR